MVERWLKLMTDRRTGSPAAEPQEARTPFQRDQDRILFSNPFRRLADKTQVFPLPPDDHVHSRLTHTIEVASVGRSLGTLVGRRLLAKHAGLCGKLEPRDIGDCVSAACLAHDIGNPPFGHVGERAIREFFASLSQEGVWGALTEEQRGDFVNFEGNAQTFRIVMKTQRPSRTGGLQLTHATLGALAKYPCTFAKKGSRPSEKSTSKHGLFSDDETPFADIANSLGLVARGSGVWRRHPLALLSEAADDIAYLLLDLEDGLRLRYVSDEVFVKLLHPMCKDDQRCPDLTLSLAEQALRLDRAEQLRAIAVDVAIGEVATAFMERHDNILDGSFDGGLASAIPLRAPLDVIREACQEYCYEADDVLRIELAGAEAISGILRFLLGALDSPSSVRGKHLRKLLPALDRPATPHEKIHRIVDHVSGMTDRYCVSQYRELLGMRYPGTRE